MGMIETRRLGRRFEDRWAVRHLDLDIAAGELFGFLGPNGAGKTTTIRMLNGLLQPSEGTLAIAERDYRSDPMGLKRITGLVPDKPPLFDYLTGRQYVALVASLYGIPRRIRDERCDRLFSLLELTDRADEICKGYSHGMQKKTHLAAVLVTEPRVLLLDEPTTGLDPRSAHVLKKLLVEYSGQGTTILLSTHVLSTAEEICNRVGILDGGQLQALGTMAELRALRGEGSLEDIFLRLTDASRPVAPPPLQNEG